MADKPRGSIDTMPGHISPAAGEGASHLPQLDPSLPPEAAQEDDGERRDEARRIAEISNAPLVEIEVVHEFGPAPTVDQRFNSLEIWTRNRVYLMDAILTCAKVRDQLSRTVVEDHPFIGARLLGGQHQNGETIEMSHPFPRPGTEAVFEKRETQTVRFFRTSTVNRVVLRLHILTVAPKSVVPTWAEITGFGGKRKG